MADLPATRMAFEKRYHDDSGVEFAVRYDAEAEEIEFECIDKVQFPLSKLDWLRDALNRIAKEMTTNAPQLTTQNRSLRSDLY